MLEFFFLAPDDVLIENGPPAIALVASQGKPSRKIISFSLSRLRTLFCVSLSVFRGLRVSPPWTSHYALYNFGPDVRSFISVPPPFSGFDRLFSLQDLLFLVH